MAECNWDPNKHNGKPCPIHNGSKKTIKKYFVYLNKDKIVSHSVSKKEYEKSKYKNTIEEKDLDFSKLKITQDQYEETMEKILDKDYSNIYNFKDFKNKISGNLSIEFPKMPFSSKQEIMSSIDEDLEDLWENVLKPELVKKGLEKLSEFEKITPNDFESSLKNTNDLYYDNTLPYYMYHCNCQRCVSTFIARMRGYNVKAKPKAVPKGDPIAQGTGFLRCFIDPEPIYNYDQKTLGKGMRRFKETVSKNILKAGDGAIFIIRTSWVGQDSGHLFIGMNQGGKVNFIDPQNGKTNYTSWMEPGVVHVKNSYICRVDNLEFNDKVGDFFEKLD